MTNSKSSLNQSSNEELIKLLSDYFSQRGTFLAQVIRADLQSSSFRWSTSNGTATPKSAVPQQKNALTLNGAGVAQALPASEIPLPPDNGHKEATPVDRQPTRSIETILVDLVVQKTGYPRDSIKLEARLLDDLNLDSIKGGELVAAVTKESGVAGKVDPSTLANATLQEIVDAVREVTQSGNEASDNRAVPTETVKVSVEEPIPWVRNFIVEYVAEEAPVTAGDSQTENWETANMFDVDNWETANVLLISEPDEAEVVEELGNELQGRGARIQTATFVEMGDRALIHSVEFTHFIAILPRTPKGEMSSATRLQRAMERVRAAATPPPASQAQRQYATVAYIQFGGGYFGRLSQVTDIEPSCTMGFAASLHLERSDLKVRVIDLPINVASASLAGRIIDELSRPEAYVAVGYDSELTRRVPRPRVQDTALYQSREITWLPNDVFLVTGGAKGITAECAFALARITGVRMALVGSSPHPQENPTGKGSAEIVRTLQRFSDERLTCRYYQCNITDAEAVRALVQRVQKELGKITGVIHGAALNKPRRVENATLEEARAEVAPKVLGVMNLCQALQDAPPKLFVGFSSISAVLGLPGNTWYGFSNEALDLILRRFGEEHPETSVLAIAFSVWAEVGMGARMGTVRNLARMGIEAMPTDEGVRRFLQLIEKDPGDPQVVVSARLGGIDTLRRGFDTWRTKRVPPPATSRFIEQVQIMEPDVEIVAQTHLSLERDSYVQDHIYKGSHLFPTVFGLEAMAQAVAYATGQSHFLSLCIEDIRLERPIVVDPEKGVDIEIRAEVLERESEKDRRQVRAEIRTEQTGFAMAHFAAIFIVDNEIDAPQEPIEIPAVPLDIEPKQDLYGWLLFQGPRFQRLQQVYTLNSKKFVFRTQRGVPTAEGTDESCDRASGPFLLGDPYYRDSLLQAVQPVVPQDICLPVHINNIQVYQPNSNASGSCIGVVILHGREGRQYNSTVFALDEDGRVIEKLDGYQLRILEHHDDYPTAEELADPSQRDERLLRRELSSRADAFKVTVPEASLVHLPGLHGLSAAQRHQRELPVFAKTVGKLLKDLE